MFYYKDKYLKLVSKKKINIRDIPENIISDSLIIFALKHGYEFKSIPVKYRSASVCEHIIDSKRFYSFGAVPLAVRTRDLCEKAVLYKPSSLRYVPSKYKTYDMCLSAVFRCPEMIQWTPYALRDIDMCQIAFDADPKHINYIPKKFQSKPMVEYVVYNLDANYSYFISKKLLNLEMCKHLVTKHDCIASEFSKYLLTNEFLLWYVNRNGLNLKYIKNQTVNICFAACINNASALQYVYDNYLVDVTTKLKEIGYL